MSDTATLVLRLAGPIQSWGGESQFNRRDTRNEPSKSGIIGLLAAARGHRRTDPLDELLTINLGIRIDQPGTVLRDYHTVSDYRGVPLLSAQVGRSGAQKPTSPKKPTAVTQRFYLQDAVFVAAIGGPRELVSSLAGAVRRPRFPLALGRRSCVPAQPLVLTHDGVVIRDEGPAEVLASLPWQAGRHHRRRWESRHRGQEIVELPVSLDDTAANNTEIDGDVVSVNDVPTTFDPLRRGFSTRRVVHGWVSIPSGVQPIAAEYSSAGHDPFELLGEV